MTSFIIMIVGSLVISIIYSKGTNDIKEREKRYVIYKEVNQIPNNNEIVFLEEFNGEKYSTPTVRNYNGKLVECYGIRKIIWKADNYIKMCELYRGKDDPNRVVEKITISMDNIVFFAMEGDYRIDNIVEGGGVSIGGALVGGALAGGVGAVLGGRKKITTTQKEVDERKTYLYYTENNANKKIVFSNKDYETLVKILPEKDIEYIEKNQKIYDIKNGANAENNVKENNNSIYEDIQKLAKLKDKGILTEGEFTEKKRLLLDKI